MKAFAKNVFISQELRVEEAGKQSATIIVPTVKDADLQMGRLYSQTLVSFQEMKVFRFWVSVIAKLKLKGIIIIRRASLGV